MRFPDPRKTPVPPGEQPSQDEAEREAHEAASAIIFASMQLRLHGIPKDRQARKRLEAALGPVLPAKVDHEYDELRHGGYDPLRRR